ncbi:hypothetical protein [Rosenbergiella epipactidis]|uniref:hypothetical protein n=1 Tax=Rosenbergiella epipactidis TaxID=1544694 RepID=UPI001F4EA7D7|nr:hypothetical protein [Rosenbergiella epipactidis]
MYLLEIELLRQEYLFRQEKGYPPENREGDYYLEKRRDNTLLQQLAKECWLYQGLPSSEIEASSAPSNTNNERLFQQEIHDSAQQLVTTLVQRPLSIKQILQQLEQELPDTVSLGKCSLETSILRIVDYPSAFVALKEKCR